MAQMASNEKSQLALLEGRFTEGVGFPHRPGGGFRPDATAWAILCGQAAGSTSGVIDKARRLLANAQGEDGRVCVSRQHSGCLLAYAAGGPRVARGVGVR